MVEVRGYNRQGADVTLVPIRLDKKEKRNITHLQTEITVIVPSTNKAQKDIGKKALEHRADIVRKYLSNLFGGYTSSQATGGYVMKNGRLVEETVIEVKSFAEQGIAHANKSKLLINMEYWARMWGQESMGLVWEGDMFFVRG